MSLSLSLRPRPVRLIITLLIFLQSDRGTNGAFLHSRYHCLKPLRVLQIPNTSISTPYSSLLFTQQHERNSHSDRFIQSAQPMKKSREESEDELSAESNIPASMNPFQVGANAFIAFLCLFLPVNAALASTEELVTYVPILGQFFIGLTFFTLCTLTLRPQSKFIEYAKEIEETCDADEPSEECATSITSYLDALSTGAIVPASTESAAAKAITSYLDNLPTNGLSAAPSLSAPAVTSYLEALSSGEVAPPSSRAVGSYLAVLSSGQVAPPSSAKAITGYLDVLSTGSTRTNGPGIVSYVDAISDTCHAEAPSRECATAITSYLNMPPPKQIEEDLENAAVATITSPATVVVSGPDSNPGALKPPVHIGRAAPVTSSTSLSESYIAGYKDALARNPQPPTPYDPGITWFDVVKISAATAAAGIVLAAIFSEEVAITSSEEFSSVVEEIFADPVSERVVPSVGGFVSERADSPMSNLLPSIGDPVSTLETSATSAGRSRPSSDLDEFKDSAAAPATSSGSMDTSPSSDPDPTSAPRSRASSDLDRFEDSADAPATSSGSVGASPSSDLNALESVASPVSNEGSQPVLDLDSTEVSVPGAPATSRDSANTSPSGPASSNAAASIAPTEGAIFARDYTMNKVHSYETYR